MDSVVDLKVLRGADTVDVRFLINSKVTRLHSCHLAKQLGTVVKKYTFSNPFPLGFKSCWETLDKYIRV
jgi:hypothetical protein